MIWINRQRKCRSIWWPAGILLLLSGLSGCQAAEAKILPNDPFYAEQTNLAAIKIEAAWTAGLTGKGVKIAVIDTGVSRHEDLDSGRISGRSYVDIEPEDITDVRGHGTFITGMLAATRNNGKGIAGLTDSDIVVLKIFGEEPHISTDHLIRAIRDGTDMGCQVMNISIGTPNPSGELEEAVDYAANKGVLIVASAGGSREKLYYPAAYDRVIGVDALTEELEPGEEAADNRSVFVTVPGEKIISLDFNGGYERNGAGASYAAVQVTALAAIAKEADPNISPKQFEEILKGSVQDKGDTGYDTLYGWGVIDVKLFCEVLKERTEKGD